MKKALILGLLLVFGSVAGAGACTMEEYQAKAETFQEVSIAAAQKDPQKYLENAQTMQDQLTALQAAGDLDAMCKFMDEWIAKLQ